MVAASQVLAWQDAERRRIARELHDCTVQDIAAAVIELDHVAGALPTTCGQAALARARRLLTRSIEDLRTLSYTLHPPFLDEFGFATALETFAEGFARLRGLVCDIMVDRDAARVVPPEIAVALIRVAQEAFANAHRHGGASRLTVRFHPVLDRGVELQIADNGTGFVMREPGEAATGVGIPGMQARMRQLGGKLRIRSDRNGTHVVAEAPLHPAPQARAGSLP
ncbi:sensor histidine kinase [Falsiroseomonas oryziterrae]|uniref:sensor histidine kinase n=1 Tax=Falsiroseomonas oryziterrae TaxID=2911368 RepID=UPI001F02C275|nr:histidine kinase [Roseomonas sp. NPKOSM-4]